MPTGFDELYHTYCYQYGKWLWIGWIESKKVGERPITLDTEQTIFLLPDSWIDYVTIGFTRYSVMKRLRKRHEKLKNIHQ